MENSLTQTVAEKMSVLPIEEQRKVVDFVESLTESKGKSLMEKLADLRESVPEEAWEKLPSDGAKNIDHYLYGATKKS